MIELLEFDKTENNDEVIDHFFSLFENKKIKEILDIAEEEEFLNIDEINSQLASMFCQGKGILTLEHTGVSVILSIEQDVEYSLYLDNLEVLGKLSNAGLIATDIEYEEDYLRELIPEISVKIKEEL